MAHTEGGRNFFTTKYTKYTKGGGRGPERGPRNTRNTRKNRSGGSEEGPERGTGKGERERSRAEEGPTEYTERGTGGGKRKRTIMRTRTIEGGRGAHGILGKGDGRWEEKENDYENEEQSRAEEGPTAYSERGTNSFTTKHTKDTKGGGAGMTGKRNGDLRGCGG